MTEKPVDLSVVIPVYNEEKTIAESMRRVEAFMRLKGWEWELLISNDGSTDRTAEVVSGQISKRDDTRVLLIDEKKNAGKGAAVRRAVLRSRGRAVLVTDADLSSPIKEIEKLLVPLEEGADIAIGSRAVRSPGADVQQTFKRWIAGRIFNGIVRSVLLRGFQDTQCGFKCFRRDPAMRLFGAQKLDGFSFDVEILYLAQKAGMKVCEVPVMWRQGQATRVRLFKDSFSMTRDLFLIRHYHGK